MPSLIVNADDFGYTPGVNQAILELHSAGALSSTSLMARGAASDDALLRLHTSSAATRPLGVGCHVVLVDGHACSPARAIPSLLAPHLHLATSSGDAPRHPRFRPSLAQFAFDLLRGCIQDREIEQEAVAQIRSLQNRGLAVSHLDTHKHTHIFPAVLRPLLRAALQCGVPAIRNPFEPAWSRRATVNAPPLRRAELSLLSRLRPAFLRLVAGAGLHTTAGSIGVLATGTLDRTTLQVLLAAVAAHGQQHAVYELVCHPGYHDAALDAQCTRLREQRATERAALLAEEPAIRCFPRLDFRDLVSSS